MVPELFFKTTKKYLAVLQNLSNLAPVTATYENTPTNTTMHTPPTCLLIRRPLPRRRFRRLRRAAAAALYYAAALTLGAVLIAALSILVLAL